MIIDDYLDMDEVDENICPLDDEELGPLLELLDDPLTFIENTLQVQSKVGQVVPLVFNKAQLKLYAEIERQRKAGKPIRLIILKARQMGFSTATAAIFYQLIATTHNFSAMIVAHKADASTAIFDKNKLFYDLSPKWLRPMKRNSNAKELLFENPSNNGNVRAANPGLRSKIEIETAVNKDARRAKTFQLLHMSELAFWPYPEETMTSLKQAVPDAPGTMIIIESTANGSGNAFYDEWNRAWRGEGVYTPLFFPWFEMDEYCMPVPKDFVITDEERELKELYDLTDGQLVWRRWCIDSNCNGNVEVFQQEYPANPREAFLATGRPVFNISALEAGAQNTSEPKEVGRVREEDGVVVFRSQHKGYLRIWKRPQDGHRYVIGIDTSQGLADGDYSSMQVVDHKTLEIVAEWHGHIEPYLLGREAAYLGRFYNLALLVPEANNTGISTIDELRRMHYARIYRRRTGPEKVENVAIPSYGFYTSRSSKALLIDALAEYINNFVGEKWHKVRNKLLLDECMTYVYDDKGSANAQLGCYDDRVIAAALALLAIKERPNYFEVNIPFDLGEIYDGVSSVTGY